MTLKALEFTPGVEKSNSEYASPGRYVDMQWTRFCDGFPQKMGGWQETYTQSSILTGVCRNILTWLDTISVCAAFGTHSKLYLLRDGIGNLYDITPLRTHSGTMISPFDTATDSKEIRVNHIDHGQKSGDFITLSAPDLVGGNVIRGNYQIVSAADNDYVLYATLVSSSSDTGVGGSTTYIYSRKWIGPNPFATTSGSPFVTVTQPNTFIAGDTVYFEDTVAVAGIYLYGAYVVVSATAADYVVNGGNNANATTTGGGAYNSKASVTSDIPLGAINSATGGGYGAGAYGVGPYGMAAVASRLARTWALHAYGSFLLANPRGLGLYILDPSTPAPRALPFVDAPATMLSFFVTSERYIVALGVDGDDLKIAWPDQLDPTMWTQTLGNTANESRHIQGGNFIMSGGEVRNQSSLIFSDTSVFLHQWRPDDYVFTTVKLADNCGLYAPNAHAVMGEVAYWIGDGQFWLWNGAIELWPSDDIRDWFFANVSRAQRTKIVMGTIGAHNEIIVLYQEIGASEINRYLLYNIKDRTWSVGAAVRTAWADRGLFTYPLATDAAGVIWNHEVGLDGDGAAIDAYITAAPMDIADGEANLDIFGFWPDIKDQVGNLSLYVLTRDQPQETPTSEGPFTLDATGASVDLRISGNMVGFKIESNVVGGNFSFGVNRVDAQPAGARRP